MFRICSFLTLLCLSTGIATGYKAYPSRTGALDSNLKDLDLKEQLLKRLLDESEKELDAQVKKNEKKQGPKVTPLGTECSDGTACTKTNSECRDDVCACKPGFMTAEGECVAGTGSVQDRDALYKRLFEDYQKDLEPDGNGSAIIAYHSIDIERLISLKDGVLTIVVWEELRWNDNRLRWDADRYNISIFHLPNRLLWRPDILLYNSAEEYHDFPSQDMDVVVTPDGTVIFVPPKVLKSTCQFDEGDLYENNEVECTLKFGSWVHSLYVLDLRIDHPPLLENSPNPHWKVTGSDEMRNVKTYECCPEPYADIEYKLKIKRIK